MQVQGSLESSLMSASTPHYLANLPVNLPSPATPLLPVSGKHNPPPCNHSLLQLYHSFTSPCTHALSILCSKSKVFVLCQPFCGVK